MSTCCGPPSSCEQPDPVTRPHPLRLPMACSGNCPISLAPRDPPTNVVALPRRRVRMALAVAAAAAVLVAGTAIVTERVSRSRDHASATQLPQLSALRTGTFQTADGQVLGQIVAYRGDPSWVFMNVSDPDYSGQITCMLQVEDGTTVAFGTFTVNNGSGQFSKNLGSVDVRALRGAKLVNSAGTPVASATFVA